MLKAGVPCVVIGFNRRGYIAKCDVIDFNRFGLLIF